jgi:YegS/Rv2252/BmrU family lipid kinase
MRIVIIINPASGRDGRRADTGPRRVALARTLLERCRADAEVSVSRAPGHPGELAREAVARGCDRVVAWGGDGTVNDVAGPLIGTGVSLGIVPAGSGDGFARGLGLPRAPAHALAVALGSQTRTVDVGRFGGAHFLNVAGVGFDAAVARAFHERRGRGLAGYLVEGLSYPWHYRAATYEIWLDGVTLSGRQFLVAFANGPQYGNDVVLAPDANPADGELDVLAVADGPPLRQFWRARRLLIRRRSPAEGLVRRRVRRARIGGDLLVYHLDGEPGQTSGTVEISLQPSALHVAVGEPALPPRR